jgi:hypothetical protein
MPAWGFGILLRIPLFKKHCEPSSTVTRGDGATKTGLDSFYRVGSAR